MFEKILLPLDGSATAQTALPVALSFAEAFNSKVELVHVLCETSDDTTIQIDPLNWHMRKAQLEMYLSSVSQTFLHHKLRCEKTMLEGTAAERIITHATDSETDLIIASSHGDGGLTGWNVSSVAQKIIARANRSVLLVRAFHQSPVDEESVEPLELKRLLVPLDGSRRAEGVLPIACKLAAAHGATVWLVHVASLASLMPPFHTYSEDLSQDEAAAHYREAADAYLHRVESQLECSTESAVIQGDTIVSALNHFVQQNDIDLVLLCAHGQASGHHRYGRVVTSLVLEGNTSLFIFQDLRPEEINPSQAETYSGQRGHSGRGRVSTHAQPAFWT